MNEQDKRALIDRLSIALNAVERGLTHYSYPTSLGEGDIISVYRTALASLTAPPVKLPKIKHPAQFDYADEVVEVLKSHGYEVEE